MTEYYIDYLPRDILELILRDLDTVKKLYEISEYFNQRFFVNSNEVFWKNMYERYIIDDAFKSENIPETIDEFYFKNLYITVMKLYDEKNLIELVKYEAYPLIYKLINDPKNIFDIFYFRDATLEALKKNNKRIASLLMKKGIELFN